MLEKILRTTERFIPKPLYHAGQPIYHFLLAFFGALLYRFPSKKIFVVGVTGTKGKTSTVELVNTILEEAGYKTALSGTLRVKTGDVSRRNLLKMTTPGRFFIQKFLRSAVKSGCDYAIIEMTSEGTKQFRHKFLDLDALIFTNLSPEHIESHGSYEKYVEAKLKIAKALERSKKKEKWIIVNGDDKEAGKFLKTDVAHKIIYSLADAYPFHTSERESSFTFEGEKITARLPGEFNIHNMLAAAAFAKTQGIDTATMKSALERFPGIPGRLEYVDEGQDFSVIVDYAHTPDSLEKVYETFGESKKICVLGAAGGGRDTWKRKEMGRIAKRHCFTIILTDEDPYDEDPKRIVDNIAEGIGTSAHTTILDRKEAIREALRTAGKGDAVLITGKGTDPYIMGPRGSKMPWSDADVVREKLRTLLKKKQ